MISIHAPCTGSDRTGITQKQAEKAFQSTLPARGATRLFSIVFVGISAFQSTLPARGATWLWIL